MAATEQKGDEREDVWSLRGDEFRDKEHILNPLNVFPVKLKLAQWSWNYENNYLILLKG